MIAADSCSVIAYMNGESGPDISAIDAEMKRGTLLLPPIVLTEILTAPPRNVDLIAAIEDLQLLEILPGYWKRAAQIRGVIRSLKLKALVADTLIAQSCIDHDVALITRDTDFRHYEKHCGLKLA